VHNAAPSRPPAKTGFHPPQQARSRAALQRLLASAEHVLINDGPEELTIARVAEHAGVSVGGVYRRFAGKEQLIDAVRRALVERLDHSVTNALENAGPSLAGVVDALATALSETLNDSARLIPAILAGGRTADPPEEGLRTLTDLRCRFFDAAAPYREQIRHPDPDAALEMTFRTVIGSATHRAAVFPWLPDGLTWQRWAGEIADMTAAYLTNER
jgi:AcrR family transcriptional regulator